MNVFTAKVKDLDKINLLRLILYYPKGNTIFEVQFCGLVDKSDVGFFYTSDEKDYMVAVNENWFLNEVVESVKSGRYAILEGDLEQIEHQVRLKSILKDYYEEQIGTSPRKVLGRKNKTA
jgi:S-adenosylmethionine:diacylglycerol 3-amino-3-carboxypropyl transferase